MNSRQRGGPRGLDGREAVGRSVGAQLVSAQQLAAVLQVAPRTIYDWVRDGYLKPLRLGRGRMLRFDVQDVLRQLAARDEG